MSELRGRVARAIADNIQAALPDGVIVDYEYAASAAIEAMRELPEDPGPRYRAGEYSRRNHQAMIDDAKDQRIGYALIFDTPSQT